MVFTQEWPFWSGSKMSIKTFLYLEDGSKFVGKSFASNSVKDTLSEIVFNTSMQGYQEIFTDPSYCDQSVVMTYPLIGNYGINHQDSEAIKPALKAIIISENCRNHSHCESSQSLESFLKENNLIGIEGIDTRHIAQKIRSKGTMKSLISMKEYTDKELAEIFEKQLPNNQVQKVSTKSKTFFPTNGNMRIALLDFGYKKNILQSLLKRNLNVFVLPYDTSFEEIEKLNPHGVLLSNGPGDPLDIADIVTPTIRKIQQKYPLFAICMGHQLFALANNAKTEKMKFGHRGANHPVLDLQKDKVYMTSQNHGYCVNTESIRNTELEITQVNLNDKTIEGLTHKSLKAFSVQYHPEASPGPNDTKFLFDQFHKEVINASK